jgi:hypothetical protein
VEYSNTVRHSIKVKPACKRGIATVGLVAAALISSTAIGSSIAAAADWTVVANSNTAIPSGGGVLFSSFGQPSINNKCSVVFRGRSTGPGEPVRGIYSANPCGAIPAVAKIAATGDAVPQPNNTSSTFTEFPAFPRVDIRGDFVASRGESAPVWVYTLPDLTETRTGTAGVYAGLLSGSLVTGASQLGAVPGFEYYDVPGFPGVKFDQFPGAPVPFDGKMIGFKGNFTDGLIGRTGVYYRNVFAASGEAQVRKIADTTTVIPGTVATTFGSTAPPSAADSTMVFAGFDIEEAPTLGGLYRSNVPKTGPLEVLVEVGDAVPGIANATFTTFGEGLSYDGANLGFWGAWGTATRPVTLHCPEDGNADIIAECQRQCPDVDAIGNYCIENVPINQGIFVRRPNGQLRLVARAGLRQDFKDFLFWVFSGRPPGVGGGDGGEDFELPRWRASAFVAVSKNGTAAASTFKATKASGETGLYRRLSAGPAGVIEPVILVGDLASTIDPAAPAGSVVSAVGVERDGYRSCVLSVNASFLNSTTSESWAGVYVDKSACAGGTSAAE